MTTNTQKPLNKVLQEKWAGWNELMLSMKFGLDYGIFRRAAFMEPRDFFDVKGIQVEYDKSDEKRFTAFLDRKASILGVAHVDTVQTGKNFHVQPYNDKKNDMRPVVHCSRLDDRAGVYVILELLPRLGVKCDVLLTTDEEKGRSTASLFKTKKEYNWIFSFDRTGDDVVMYQYDTPQLRESLSGSGFSPGIGSFSDICVLDHLGVLGFNVGVGYHNYHAPDAYLVVPQLVAQTQRFVEFYKKFGKEKLPYVRKPRKEAIIDYGGDYDFYSYPPARHRKSSLVFHIGEKVLYKGKECRIRAHSYVQWIKNKSTQFYYLDEEGAPPDAKFKSVSENDLIRIVENNKGRGKKFGIGDRVRYEVRMAVGGVESGVGHIVAVETMEVDKVKTVLYDIWPEHSQTSETVLATEDEISPGWTFSKDEEVITPSGRGQIYWSSPAIVFGQPRWTVLLDNGNIKEFLESELFSSDFRHGL